MDYFYIEKLYSVLSFHLHDFSSINILISSGNSLLHICSTSELRFVYL